jgi:hypothetical protein
MAAYPLIDIYCHIYPEKFFQEMTKVSPQTENLGKRLRTITKLFDLGERFREMDSFGDYRQIISLPILHSPSFATVQDKAMGRCIFAFLPLYTFAPIRYNPRYKRGWKRGLEP